MRNVCVFQRKFALILCISNRPDISRPAVFYIYAEEYICCVLDRQRKNLMQHHSDFRMYSKLIDDAERFFNFECMF